jgi:hypothetical protein
MTLVVGAVGSNGIALAADRLFLDPPRDDSEIDDRMDGGKLVALETHRVVYGFAGDFISQLVGEELKDKLGGETGQVTSIDLFLQDIANQVVTRELNKNVNLNLVAKRKLLVVFYGEQVTEQQLWSLDIRPNTSQAERIYGLVVAGARGNAARFFQHYYRYNLPVESLKFLVAHIVLAGHSWNGDIDGLDVALVGKSIGFNWLQEDEKSILRERFSKLDDIIRSSLLDPARLQK